MTLRNNQAKDALVKIVDVLSAHKNSDGDASLEQGLQPEIRLLRSEIISSSTPINLLLSSKAKLSELEDKNNNLQVQHKGELKKLSESLNNYKKSVANQVKLIENMGEQAERHEADINNYQLEIKNNQLEINKLKSKTNQLKSKTKKLEYENKTLKTDLQKAKDELENLKALGEDMSAQIGGLKLL